MLLRIECLKRREHELEEEAERNQRYLIFTHALLLHMTSFRPSPGRVDQGVERSSLLLRSADSTVVDSSLQTGYSEFL